MVGRICELLKQPCMKVCEMAWDSEDLGTIEISVPEDIRGWFTVSQPVSVATLRDNLRKFVSSLDAAFKDVPSALASYDLDEVEVSVTVSAEGGVSLLGSGGKAGVEGGLKLTFSRKNKAGAALPT
jgi:hypothetical protein